jgi:8-amino-7-oxononanoate synthase
VFEEDLKILEKSALIRTIRDRTSAQGARVVIGGREYLNFASNDYLGLSAHPALLKAATRALESYGMGSGASRLLGGGSDLHEELEARVASFKGTGAALLMNSGYSANAGVVPAIASEGDAVFSDELNHASLIDGSRLSRAKTHIYRHRDIEHLEGLLKNTPARRKIVVTDSVFSMDGDIVPLKGIYDLCLEYGAVLYLDDAHATGVLGGGKGSLEHFSLRPEPWIIQMGTFSKALGSFGAFAAGSPDAIEWLVNSARSFIYSTALPACVVAASLEAMEIIDKDTMLLERLWRNRERLFSGLKTLGFDTGESETPIIPIIMESVPEVVKLSERLAGEGIYAPAIRPPTVKAPRIRLSVTAAHTDEDIAVLLEALR